MRIVSQIQKLSESKKIGLRFEIVSKFQSFLFSSLVFLCSCNMKGIARTETIKYLQEFLVSASDLTSAKSQHGTKAEKSTLMKRRIQAARGDT
jgi:hypothetical protein